VAEADEYKGNFLNYSPKILVLTNMEYDHPDFFKNFREYQKTFEAIIKKVPKDGVVIYNKNDKNLAELVRKTANCKIRDYASQNLMVELMVPGEHNIFNAKAVLGVADYLGVDIKPVTEALSVFEGTRRRFEIKSKTPNFIFIDDYAHHPTEIEATLKAAKEKYSNFKIISVFQPHTFSRTEALLEDFANAFRWADKLVLLDIYGSAREKKGSIHSRDLAEKIRQTGYDNVSYKANLEEAAAYIKRKIKSGVILTMGAGDVYKLISKLKISCNL
jgi:UDP-N-acetylmuramate--alanine ligase